jgi:uncharacterized membrane protein YqaE (UPF0057 family)
MVRLSAQPDIPLSELLHRKGNVIMQRVRNFFCPDLAVLLKVGLCALHLAVVLLLPAFADAQIRFSGSGGSLNGSLNNTNNDLLAFLKNDVAMFCMIVGGILAIITHVFNKGMGTTFFLSVFGAGVIASSFDTVISLARGLASGFGH